jgi:hypothetical protein
VIDGVPQHLGSLLLVDLCNVTAHSGQAEAAKAERANLCAGLSEHSELHRLPPFL